MSLTEHLDELRSRIILSLAAVLVTSLFTLWHSRTFMRLVLDTARPVGISFIAITPAETFFTQLKVALFSALILAMPIVLWQAWLFVRPGLRLAERRFASIIVPGAIAFFAAGTLFAYLILVPLAVAFLAGFGTDLATPQYSIDRYTSFVLFFLLTLGLAFEAPLVLLILGRIGLLTSADLASRRRVAVIGIFVASAILTPTPDLVTQCLMALPLVLLLEGTIWLMRALRM